MSRVAKYEDDEENDQESVASTRKIADRSKIDIKKFQADMKTFELLLKDAGTMLVHAAELKKYKHPAGNDRKLVSSIRDARDKERNEQYIHVGESGKEIALSLKAIKQRYDDLVAGVGKMGNKAARIYKPKKVKEGDAKIPSQQVTHYINDAGRDFYLSLSYGNGAALGFTEVGTVKTVKADRLEYIRRFLDLDGNNKSDREKINSELQKDGDRINQQFRKNLAVHGVDPEDYQDLTLGKQDVNINAKIEGLLRRNIITRDIMKKLWAQYFSFTKLRSGHRLAMRGTHNGRNHEEFETFLRNDNGFRCVLNGKNLESKLKTEKLISKYEKLSKESNPLEYIRNKDNGVTNGYDRSTGSRFEAENIDKEGVHSNFNMEIESNMLIPDEVLTDKQKSDLAGAQEEANILTDEIARFKTAYDDAKKYLNPTKTAKKSVATKKTKTVSTLSSI